MLCLEQQVLCPQLWLKENSCDCHEGTEKLPHQSGQEILKAQILNHELSSTPIILHGNPLHWWERKLLCVFEWWCWIFFPLLPFSLVEMRGISRLFLFLVGSTCPEEAFSIVRCCHGAGPGTTGLFQLLSAAWSVMVTQAQGSVCLWCLLHSRTLLWAVKPYRWGPDFEKRSLCLFSPRYALQGTHVLA